MDGWKRDGKGAGGGGGKTNDSLFSDWFFCVIGGARGCSIFSSEELRADGHQK